MKQNHLLFSAVTALAFLASCSSDNVVADASQEADTSIKFNTSINNITRAETTSSNFTEFKVTAFEKGSTTAYFSDKVIKNSGSGWSPENGEKLYWPKSGKALQFYAFSPTSITPIINSTAKQLVDYTNPTDVNNQADILTSYNEQQLATDNTNKSVTLAFKHALAKVIIQARNETSVNYSVHVKGVRVGNVKSQGTMTFQENASNCATWGSLSTSQNYEIGGKTDNSYTEKEIDKGTKGSNIATDLMNGKTLLLIPQTTTPWDKNTTPDDNGARISICCQIKNGGTKIFPSAGGVDYGWISVPLTATWQAGNKYIYTIRFFADGSGNAGTVDPGDTDAGGGGDPMPNIEIGFETQIGDWVDGNGSGESIPSE